jgi:hypothetical protein
MQSVQALSKDVAKGTSNMNRYGLDIQCQPFWNALPGKSGWRFVDKSQQLSKFWRGTFSARSGRVSSKMQPFTSSLASIRNTQI